VGFELYVHTDTPTLDRLGLYRIHRVKQGESYMVSRGTTENGKKNNCYTTIARSGDRKRILPPRRNPTIPGSASIVLYSFLLLASSTRRMLMLPLPVCSSMAASGLLPTEMFNRVLPLPVALVDENSFLTRP
jgi:hypothetical protein